MKRALILATCASAARSASADDADLRTSTLRIDLGGNVVLDRATPDARFCAGIATRP